MSQAVGNSHIPMPGGQAVSPPMIGVISCKCVYEPYITKT